VTPHTWWGKGACISLKQQKTIFQLGKKGKKGFEKASPIQKRKKKVAALNLATRGSASFADDDLGKGGEKEGKTTRSAKEREEKKQKKKAEEALL